ncbi:MAG: chromosomal replication initiator protein DnaA, partial [Tenericutes bacterium]|nr:chromosomal replication initiator protein DnaA [Mycoplasmatota bacterium]
MNNNILWQKFLDAIKTDITPIMFDTWFKETSLYKIEDDKVIIIVPFAIHKKQLVNNYSELIVNKFAEIANKFYDFEYILENEVEDKIIIEDLPKDIESFDYKDTNLNKKYTFENFVVGKSNKLAYEVALAVAQNPGITYNPLFIYGNSGLGKTHLMHAVGNYIINHFDKKVLYVTSDNFITDFIKISKKNEDGNNYDYAEIFKNKYRNVDVLIIDDIQFLGGATKTQQEFFNTFQNLHQNEKQIIISSDRSQNDLKLLEDRLKTRFSWGITVDILPPEYELRIKIFKNKLKAEKIEIEIPDDVIKYIATNIGDDVRAIEGSLNRLLAYTAIMGFKNINLEVATEALKDFLYKNTNEINSINKIQKIVAEYFK